MSDTLAQWNTAAADTALASMLACCGARRWAEAMIQSRPVSSAEVLFSTADAHWQFMAEPDWLEAFACHPRIGERPVSHTPDRAGEWSRGEQASALGAQKQVLADLAAGNADYQQRFGFTYIVCATGKSAEEMLALLNRRLLNTRAQELGEAAEQQRQIMQIRLRKWLQS